MASFPILVNSVVHIIMYAYYQLSSMGPTYHKFTLKYKKYVTIIQLVIIYIKKLNYQMSYILYSVIYRFSLEYL